MTLLSANQNAYIFRANDKYVYNNVLSLCQLTHLQHKTSLFSIVFMSKAFKVQKIPSFRQQRRSQCEWWQAIQGKKNQSLQPFVQDKGPGIEIETRTTQRSEDSKT